MVKYSPRDLANSMNVEPSDQDGPLQRAYRELEELRERVRRAELAAAKSRGQSSARSL